MLGADACGTLSDQSSASLVRDVRTPRVWGWLCQEPGHWRHQPWTSCNHQSQSTCGPGCQLVRQMSILHQRTFCIFVKRFFPGTFPYILNAFWSCSLIDWPLVSRIDRMGVETYTDIDLVLQKKHDQLLYKTYENG